MHEQTLATYRLLAELKSLHPGLEIESCSSGGARVDLGILEFTDGVWASDCIDPLERQQILRWTAQLLPPELVGSHIGSPHSHTTGRTHDLSFRAATALFGHYGIEWDITALTAQEQQELGHWIGVYKEHRALMHHGTVVRVDHPTPEISAHGIIAADRTQAIFEFTVLSRPACWPPVPVRIKGLDPERNYRIRQLGPTPPLGTNNNSPAWMNDGGILLSGAMLAAAGLAMPPLQPEHSVVVYLESDAEIRSSHAAS
ncbi:alpha-galactosidase [Arthrobacter psychrolactophilus]